MTLECLAIGNNPDTPFNSWTKDSVDIIENDRISVTVSQSSARSLLEIRNLLVSDAGVYTCSKEGFHNVSWTINVETGPGMLLKLKIK